MLLKDKKQFSEAIQQEWLETNGLGGWSSSTIIGCNTRRYHGLLVAATVPPAERTALVSKMDETIIVDNAAYELGTNNYGNAIHPAGYPYLQQFKKDCCPEFIYEAGGVQLRKTIGMIHNENTVVIEYEVLKATLPFVMELLPLLSVRGYHALMHANDAVNKEASFENDIFHTKLYNETPRIYIKVPQATYHASSNWFYNFNYSVEQYRGLDFIEDLFNPGKFSVELNAGDVFSIIISTTDPTGRNGHELLAKERMRRQSLLKDQPANTLVQQLILAADQFIVKRDDLLKTIIAGYHWFTDWGRDTMISLPGLCLSTGRYEDAKKIIAAFAKSVSMGMLPNRFQDNGDEPEYNNVDGTLWYFIAVYKYLQAKGDINFLLSEILPVLKDIIDWHYKGTRYNIQADDDGLLYAGEEGQQLTWMDARIGNWVVTPRMGKPVEIQALWYNALVIFSKLLELNGQHSDAGIVNSSAEKVKQHFAKLFWNAEGQYLYDNILPDGTPSAEFRPNQLFAISLPFALMEGDKAKQVFESAKQQLYTPVGLRTLPANDIHYIHHYGGDAFHRDAAYHEGTVWSWLLGPYTDALLKTGGSLQQAQEVINNFSYHLEEGCIGSVSEIFDADAPHHPRGCIAQAWGVAEILRVVKEYHLWKPAGSTVIMEQEAELAEL